MADYKELRAGAIKTLSTAGKGTLDALADLLMAEIEEAHLEMETADNDQKLWRAQGRVTEARSLITVIDRLRAKN